MSWLAILLSMASLGGSATPSKAPVQKHCTSAKQHCKTVKPKPKKKPVAKVKPREDAKPNTPGAQRDDAPSSQGESPSATPTPTATPKPGATPTPVPTVTPVPTATPDPIKYPSRTGVDLTEWDIRSSYRTLATGRVVFSANNLGEDDHNLSVRSGATEYGKVEVAPGDNAPLVLQLAPGSYTLYCSLTGHEAAGMKTEITVR